MANSYNSAAEYLNKMRQELASKKSAGHALLSTTSEYILPVTEASSLTDAVSATSAVIGTYDVTDNVGSLIAYIPFDLTCDDVINTGRSAANRNDGTVTGTETYVTGPEISSTHKLRKAFSFNGSSYVTLANENNADFEYTNTFSISCWYKSSNAGNIQDVVTKQNGPTSAGFRLSVNSANTPNFVLRTGATAYAVNATSTTANNGVWHHMVGTYAGTSNQSGLKIYFDGVLESTGTSSAIASTILNAISVIIGANGDTTRKLTGQESHVQIWNKELTSDDVTRLYAGKQINRDTAATNPAYIGISDIS